ncbi:DNA-binding response regulator [Hirschia litorea]|uniref:DNA-binding response regulator n=1 Tax=Hirschia litorea TaxID=1199156 RepID=A0ABW2IIK3_9PROT
MNILKPSICFVDDDQGLLDGLRRSLNSMNAAWDMCFFTSPLKALEAAKTKPIDVLVSDLKMPELSGQALISEVMATEGCSSARYIILSGSGDFSSAISAINDLHVFRFLEKPVDKHVLIQAIEDAVTDAKPDLSVQNYAEAALNMITAAVVVVSEECRVLYANPAGRKLLENKIGLVVGIDGICRASNCSDSQALHDMIAQASIDEDDRVRWLSLKDQCADTELNFVAIPQGSRNFPGGRTVVLLSRSEETVSSLAPEVLQSMFGLTPAEAAITFTITQGGNLDEAARRSGITVSSARTYLKRIFGKTGASRQAELMKIVLTSPAAIVKKRAS